MKTALFTGIGFAALAFATAGSVQADDFCREYQRRVTIGGKIQDSYGTACLQPDGSWKTVNEGDPQIVGSVAPEPVYIPQPQPMIVYEEEPLYVPYQTTYRSYNPSPIWWGVNLSFNDRDRHHGWRDNRGWDRGHGRHGHGGPGRGHHGPGRGHDRH